MTTIRLRKAQPARMVIPATAHLDEEGVYIVVCGRPIREDMYTPRSSEWVWREPRPEPYPVARIATAGGTRRPRPIERAMTTEEAFRIARVHAR